MPTQHHSATTAKAGNLKKHSASYSPPKIQRAARYGYHQIVIVKDRDIPGGTPVFRGTRVPIPTLFDCLQAGETLADFLQGLPTVTRESTDAALAEAKQPSPRPFLASPRLIPHPSKTTVCAAHKSSKQLLSCQSKCR